MSGDKLSYKELETLKLRTSGKPQNPFLVYYISSDIPFSQMNRTFIIKIKI